MPRQRRRREKPGSARAKTSRAASASGRETATDRERSRIDIERGSFWLVSEDQRGFRFRRWTAYVREGSPTTAEGFHPSNDTSEAA
jgi:hypothetical protein